MVRLGIILILYLSLFIGAVCAKTQTVRLRNGAVSFELPSDKWSFYKDMLGLPLVIVSPSKKKQRITISVTATGINKLKLDPDKLEAEQKTWFLGRKRFVDKFNGVITKKYDYKKFKTVNLERVHRIGYQYKVEEKTFESFSYFYNCKAQLYHVKSLGEINLFPDVPNISDDFLNTLSC